MSSYVSRTAPQQPYYQRQGAYAPPAPQRVGANVKDDYERWYTETTPNNRMTLSIRSGIHSEIAWALDRLCRLGINDGFSYKSYPGLIDGLFDWPEWYISEGYKELSVDQEIFGPSKEFAAQHRFALESLLLLRNVSLQDPSELQHHSHTISLILNGLKNLDHTKDRNQEALLHIIEIMHGLAPNMLVNETVPDCSNPILPLTKIVSTSKNRSLIIAALGALNGVLSHPGNARQFTRTSPSLRAAIRYLPLFQDKQLLEPCLEHIYQHVAHPASARAFLLNPELRSVLKVLCSLILAEQSSTVERVALDITPKYRTVTLSSGMSARPYELSQGDIESLAKLSEPHRSTEWMRLVLSPRHDAEMTQVDVWTLYKDTFAPFADTTTLLVATEVIKNVSHVFPSAQAMVLPGPSPRFIVRGIERRQELFAIEKFKCLWNHSNCPQQAFTSPSELFDHLLEHLANMQQAPPLPCQWSTCNHTCPEMAHLRAHLLTHLASSQPQPKHPSQSDTVTLALGTYDVNTHPPTSRPLPPLRNATVSYEKPIVDPPSVSLTALLIIRVLFRTAFASNEAAPKADADHFGFPGIVEDVSDPSTEASSDPQADKRGEACGRKAFVGVRNLLQNIRIRDEALMSWVTEMVDATMPELN